jgi:hypothetical protein
MNRFELGGTWADSRHDISMPNLFSVALYLENFGYDLYIIGYKGFFRVSPAFFWLNHNFKENVEGVGYYIPGNALAVSKDFADARIKQVIKDNLFLELEENITDAK